jgi:hypothetical protein
MTAHVPRLNSRVLTVFLLVSLPVLIVGSAVVLAFGHARLSASYGQHLEDVAQQAAAGIDAYVYRRILDVALLARTPDLRREAAASSRAPVGRAGQARRETSAVPAAAAPDNAASRYLADLVAQDRTYHEMLLTDRQGRLVAAGGPSTGRFYGDADWWRAAFDDGRQGRVSISDVHWDRGAGSHLIAIAAPVQAPEDGALVGILRVVADSRELIALVGNLQLGESGGAWLLRRNGSVVFSRRAVDPNARFFASDVLTSRMTTMRQSGPIGGTYFEARGPDGSEQIVGVAESQLGASYPSLQWIVAVSQARSELLAPVAMVGWYLGLLVGLVALIVLALALWFSVRLAAPQVDVDMHLVEHPQVSHVGELDEAAAHGRP